MLVVGRPLPLGALAISAGSFGWELRRITGRDGTYEVEAIASPRWRDVLEAGRIDALRRGFAPKIDDELRGSAEWWPRPLRGPERVE